MGRHGDFLKGEFDWSHPGSLLLTFVARPRNGSLWGRTRQWVVRQADAALREAVRRLDAGLRRWEHIEEFSRDEQCILRLSLGRSERDFAATPQLHIEQGDCIGEIHLWNERLDPFFRGGPDLEWAALMRRRMAYSMALLAEHARSDPRLAAVKVFHAKTAFGTGKPWRRIVRFATAFGFEVTERRTNGGFWGTLAQWGESIYLWAMTRTFACGLAKNSGLIRPQWIELWITRETLLARYDARSLRENEASVCLRS